MAHPHGEHRAHKVERSRVNKITSGYESGDASHSVKHYAKGGAVHGDEAQDRKLVKKMLKQEEKAEKASGGSVRHRADRFARGGKVKAKGSTTVNVNISPSAGPPPLSASQPPRPVAPPIPAGPPMAPAPGGAPPMPMRASGGGVNGVYPTPGKGTPVWRSSVKDGTPVQHAGNKDDGKDIGRGKVVTYKTGGAVEHAVKGQMAPHLPGGSGGGEARLAKAHKRHSAMKGTFSNASGK